MRRKNKSNKKALKLPVRRIVFKRNLTWSPCLFLRVLCTRTLEWVNFNFLFYNITITCTESYIAFFPKHYVSSAALLTGFLKLNATSFYSYWQLINFVVLNSLKSAISPLLLEKWKKVFKSLEWYFCVTYVVMHVSTAAS